MPLDRTRDLLILQAGRRLTEVPPPLVATAEELGRDAGRAAATWVFDGSTPEEAYQRVLRGIDEGDPAVLDAIEPPAIGPAAGYDQDDLARDLGIEPGDRALPRAVSAYADAFTGSFWRETGESIARQRKTRTGKNAEIKRSHEKINSRSIPGSSHQSPPARPPEADCAEYQVDAGPATAGVLILLARAGESLFPAGAENICGAA